MPRGFESLEPRHALDGIALTLQVSLPDSPLVNSVASTPAATPTTASNQNLPLLAMRVYAAPIGPQPAPPAAAATLTSSALPPMTLGAFQQLGAALPIGPARPANLPAQTPVTPTQPLYADGFLPTNPNQPSLPSERQSMPILTDPPGLPTLSIRPPRPLL